MENQKDQKRFKVPQVKLSEYERLHIVEGFSEDVRNDGRGAKQFRPISLETNVLPQLDGSARLISGEVDITVGVRAELETVVDATYYEGKEKPLKIDFNVELSANSSTKFLGHEPMNVAETVRSALERAYSNKDALPTLECLQLTPRLSWNLFVDIEVNNFDGNVLDFAAMALKAALTEFKIPQMRVISDSANLVSREIEGVEIPFDVKFVKLNTSRCPLFITVNLVNETFAVDVTEKESICATSSICVAAILNDENGKPFENDSDCLITHASTLRRGTMEVATAREIYKFAILRLKELNEKLDELLAGNVVDSNKMEE